MVIGPAIREPRLTRLIVQYFSGERLMQRHTGSMLRHLLAAILRHRPLQTKGGIRNRYRTS